MYNLCTVAMPVLLSYLLLHPLNFPSPPISTSSCEAGASVVFQNSWFSVNLLPQRQASSYHHGSCVSIFAYLMPSASLKKSRSRMHTSVPESFVTSKHVAFDLQGMSLSSLRIWLLVLSNVSIAWPSHRSPQLSALSATWLLCDHSCFYKTWHQF